MTHKEAGAFVITERSMRAGNSMVKINKQKGARGTAQQLKAEDTDSVTGARVVTHNWLLTLVPGDLVLSSDFCGYQAQTCMQAKMLIYIK